MKRLTFIFAGLALLAASPAVLKTTTLQTPATAPVGASTPAEQSQTMVKTYCTGCHNSKSQNPAGGLALDTLNVQAPAEHPEIWEKAIRKLRGRLMPPPGARQPEQKEIDSLIGYLENTLDSNNSGPKTGHVGI